MVAEEMCKSHYLHHHIQEGLHNHQDTHLVPGPGAKAHLPGVAVHIKVCVCLRV